MADHSVSESLYFHDPDNNGIEVYRDRKPAEWGWTGANKVLMVTEPLDINNLLNHESYGTWNGFPAKTSIGHVHLHVSNLHKAKNFYQDMLGLYHRATYPGAISLPQIDITIKLPPTLGSEQTSYKLVQITRKTGLDHFAIRIPGIPDDKKRKTY